MLYPHHTLVQIWPLNWNKKTSQTLKGSRLYFKLFSCCVLFQSAGITIFLWLLPLYQIPRQFLSAMYKTVWYNLSGKESFTCIVIILGLLCNVFHLHVLIDITLYFENSFNRKEMSAVLGTKMLKYLIYWRKMVM